ncbi:MAG: hypothetical protein M0P71_10280 [Melioribacteraceae bacterium]|nr:hypothetical protein [Melioribacteraceae bacterium]
MKKNQMYWLLILILCLPQSIYSQSEEPVFELYLIDSFITTEEPYTLIVSFFTSEECKSSIRIGEKDFLISKEYTEDHKIKIDLSGFELKKETLGYELICGNKDGKFIHQKYSANVPSNKVFSSESEQSLLTVCCLGGVIFGIPSPSIFRFEDKTNFGFSKEIPLFSFYSKSFNYPYGFVSIEYTHILKGKVQNLFRIGYKQIFQIDGIEYISPGITYNTNFAGYNGIGTEVSAGLFSVSNIFTFYGRYRYNYVPGNSKNNFHEFSIGLYSNFFSINF